MLSAASFCPAEPDSPIEMLPQFKARGPFAIMIKLNRIGNKLGVVGLFGVLLSGGMVVNQMASESAINSASHRASLQQTIADHTFKATSPCGEWSWLFVT